MTYKNKLFVSLSASKAAPEGDDAGALAELMSNPEYLRHSSTIINDALKEGFDVLQLPNGDIVTTGTRIITNTYVWDAAKGKLSKARASTAEKTSRRAKEAAVDEEDAE